MEIGRAETRKYVVWAALALGTGLVLFPALAFLTSLVFSWPHPTVLQDQRYWTITAFFAVLLGATALVARGLDERARPRPSINSARDRRERVERRPRIDPVLAALVGLAGVVLFQLVPLPAGLVGVMSPERLRLAREVAEATAEKMPAWLPLTVCLESTRNDLLLLVAYVSVFYAASVLFASGRRWKLIFGAAVAGACVLTLPGFGQVLEQWGTRLSSTFISPNRFAAFLAMGGACAIGMFVTDRGERRRERLTGDFRFPRGTVWIVAAVVIETALLLTLSRLGIASVVVAGLLVIALFVGRRSIWAVLAGVLLVLAANAALAADPVLARYSILFEESLLGRGRPRCWRMAVAVVAHFPVFGSGAGTFKHVFRLYQEPSLPGWYTFAHNDYLNALCDVGLLGLAAVVAAISFAARRVVALRSSRNPHTRAVAIAGLLGVSAVLLHSLADFPLQEPAVALLFFTIAGVANGRALEREQGREGASERGAPLESPGRRPRWILPVYLAAAAVLCAATLPVLVRLRVAGKLKAEASRIPVGRDEEIERVDLLRRVGLLERAAAADPWDATARYEAARTRVRLMLIEDTGAHAHEAERELRDGRATSPIDPRPYYLGAVLAWRPDSMEHPDRMMLLALRMAPAWHDVSYQVGRYFLKRWLHAKRAEDTFGLVRWQGTVRGVSGQTREPDELFARVASSLTFAARSPEARRSVVELVLDHGLSALEIDAALSPDVETELALARGLTRRGSHGRACARYERALSSGELRPPLHRVHVSYAQSLLGASRPEAALKQFDNALRTSPLEELDATIRKLGSLRPEPRDAALAVQYWDNVRARLRDEPAVILALARAEFAAGDEESGFAHMLEYATDAKDAGAFAGLARFTLAQGELKLAATLAAEAARYDPDLAKHHLLLARILVLQGRNEHAAAALGRVLLLKPRNLGAARTLASIELKAERYPRAISVWNRFLEFGGAPAPAHEALADIYLKLLYRERAASELNKALEAKPGDKRLREKLRAIQR